MIRSFTDRAWEHYLYWQSQDKKTLKKINTLLKEIDREPFVGTGKPEPLRGQYSGAWSRRINEKDRIIYLIDGEHIYILSLKDHYDDK